MAIITGALSAANQNEWIANIRKRTYYNEILTRMSARRMELIQMTPDGVLKNLRTLIPRRKPTQTRTRTVADYISKRPPMCLMLYIATTDEQPLRNTPELSVEAVAPADESVRQWFSLPIVRFVGAHGGCSCGFRHVYAEEPIEYWEGMFDLSDKQDEDLASVQSLIALVQEHVAATGEVQIYPVWNGDEQLPPKGTIELLADTLNPRTFFFNERFFYRVLPNAG